MLVKRRLSARSELDRNLAGLIAEEPGVEAGANSPSISGGHLMRQTTFSRAHRRALPEQASRSRVALAEAASAICNPAGDPPELDLQNSVPACTLPSI